MKTNKTNVQGEPVAYLFPDEMGRTKIVLGKETAEHWCPPYESITPLYAAPQPTPDVTALVEALTELCDEIDKHEIHAAISKTSISWFKLKAREALATYRKGELNGN